MKKISFLLFSAGFFLTAAGCGDSGDTGKILGTVGGAGLGALAGNALVKGQDKTLGTVVGGVAGGGLGFLLGGALGGDKK
jgi:outer membrane lipoprotein SlyB